MKKPNSKDKKYRMAYGGFNTALYIADDAKWDAEQRARADAREAQQAKKVEFSRQRDEAIAKQHAREDARKAQRWENTDVSVKRNTGQPQTNTYFGDKGLDKHAHVAHNSDGNFIYGRDVDGSAIDASQVSAPKE